MPRCFGPRKYDPLTAYLMRFPGAQVTLTLVEIEAILGAPLPPSTRGHTWWGNTVASAQARAWLSAGWRMARTQLHSKPPAVTFARRAGSFSSLSAGCAASTPESAAGAVV
jgi:hypothetical protein